MDMGAVDVSEWAVAADETAGQDEKVWLVEPQTGVLWLFKPPTVKGGFRQREDLCEFISFRLAQLLGVPCAQVRLAVRGGRAGSISRDLRPSQWEMQSGAVLLAESDPSYLPGIFNLKGRPGHSLSRIDTALFGATAPLDSMLPPTFTAFDAFAGYLTLDAWIANRDRHDENWSILLPNDSRSGPRRLCGGYDQAGCLGYNVTDESCADWLTQPGAIAKWAQKGTAWRFEHAPGTRPQTLVELAVSALDRCDQQVKDYWVAKLAAVTVATDVPPLLPNVTDLSGSWRNFILELLRINQERLLHACRDV
ncbi:hypothetical protein A5761_15340 [Mycolicibacterium setense]|uniref:hypothetical protein n=1 Tax=Mycolicibacterium setense TaxID=431269 RepID=UPI0007E9C00F|nr:hypothetical protein [Mycolicibacterium setense]OBB14694.1 hypothetical protein A5761_15340 [Mycolicibacterium setense]